jgi:hypothetical protein
VLGGLKVLVVVLAAASAAGWGMRRRNGRFRVPGRPTRELLTEVAGSRDGVALVEIDAARRRDLARRLNVLNFPPNRATIAAESARPRVTAGPSVNTIWYVSSRTARMLTKRRAVDFCLVATAICRRSAPAA